MERLVSKFLQFLIFLKTLKILEASSPIPLNITQASNSSQAELVLKLEQVFGQNFLKTYQRSSEESSEEFSTIEEEYAETSSTSTLPPAVGVTRYPILIPSEIDTVTELWDSVNLEEENKEIVYLSAEEKRTGSFPKTRGRISSSSHFKRNCGEKVENCEKRKPNFNYRMNPHICRCDRGTCDSYGDCCWTIAATLLYRNPWRCHRVQHEDYWALMISKCSESYKASEDADRGLITSCESPYSLSPHSYTHSHDIPVYSNRTNELFRNIYCSRCNGLGPRELLNMKLVVRCSKPFNSSEEKESFLKGAKYQRGKRIWIVENESSNTSNIETTACGIFAPDLEPRRLPRTIPNARYCKPNAIDKCPKDFAKIHPTTAALCNSYTQYVESRPGFLFKNPHCAQCYGLDPKWDLRCHKGPGPSKGTGESPRVTPGVAGASLDSSGLSLLFDFDLGGEGNYVGYEATCGGDSIWDFLRQRCSDLICAKDHELDQSDLVCKPKGNETEEQLQQNVPENFTTANMPNCYVLIIHDSEYTLLPNKSILVNQISEDDSSSIKQLLFPPSEYQVWNSSSLSICARELSSSFRQRFSPLLNYISSAALSLSVFFSCAHLALFCALPKMRNLPGKNLACLTLCLLISQLLFLSFISSKNSLICISSSVLMHYFFLASFFWMTVMSVDIWRTFSIQFMRHSSSSGGGGRGSLFIKYSLWGWLSPLLIIVASCFVDFVLPELKTFEDSANLRKLRPLYGHNNLCWIGQGLALFLFFALPTVLLILLNIFLFTATTKAILEQSKDAQRVLQQRKSEQSPEKSASTSSEAEVMRMKLYVKLGVIMGVTWILGFLSGLSEWGWLWYPFVLVNGLQGTFIFFGFDAKPKIWKMLRERCGFDEGRSNLTVTNISTAAWRRETTTSTSGNGGGNGAGRITSISKNLQV